MGLIMSNSKFSSYSVALPVALLIAVAGCAKKQPLPNNAAQLGLNGANTGGGAGAATPGSARDFTVNVGDRVFFTTDSTTREYNLALGARRASATRDYLSSRGVNRSRINTISFGKERPVAVCNDISCWSQNRRAVTVLSGGNS